MGGVREIGRPEETPPAQLKPHYPVSLIIHELACEKVRRCVTVDSTPRQVMAITTLLGTAGRPQLVLWIKPEGGEGGQRIRYAKCNDPGISPYLAVAAPA